MSYVKTDCLLPTLACDGEKQMPVFKIERGKLSKIRPIRFPRKEKELQNLVENNLDIIFDMTFVKSEHPTSHGGRIDTLALDSGKRPVIIEYKEDKSSTILLQGLYYMDWLIENQAEFEKLVRENLKREIEINWRDGVRLLLIAKEFEIWDKSAVNRVSDDVELFSYNLYQNDEIKIEKVPLPTDFKPKVKMGITLSQQTTVEQHLEKIVNEEMKQMATDLRESIKNISDDIKERATLYHIIFRTTFNFARIYTQKKGFWFDVKIPRNEFRIEDLDVRGKDQVWTHIRVNKDTDFGLLVKAANEAYERTL